MRPAISKSDFVRAGAVREADYDAYDLDDPKHPDWEDAAAERADLERKREKEDLPCLKRIGSGFCWRIKGHKGSHYPGLSQNP